MIIRYTLLAFVVICSWGKFALGEVQLKTSSSKEDEVSVRVSGLRDLPPTALFEKEDGKKLEPSWELARSNYWILVDTSTMCSTQKIPTYLQTLISSLKKMGSNGTKVSLLGFSANHLETYAINEDLSSLKSTLQCQMGSLSSSYEKPLRHLLDQEYDQSLPVRVLILSSGNLKVPEALLKEIKQKELTVDAALYNPFVESAVRKVIWEAQKTVGVNRLQFRVLNSNPEKFTLPEISLIAKVSPDLEDRGKKKSLLLKIVDGDQVLAQSKVQVQFGDGVFYVVLRKIGLPALFLLFLGLVLFALYRVVRYYAVPKCSSCQRKKRYRQKEVCLFCEASTLGFLVQRNDQETLLPVRGKGLTVGTSQKASFQIAATKGVKGKVFSIKDFRDSNEEAYFQIEAFHKDLRVNGRSLKTKRFLGNGDVIDFHDERFEFLYGKSLIKEDKNETA